MNAKKRAKKRWKRAGKAFRERVENKHRVTYHNVSLNVPPPCPDCQSTPVLMNISGTIRWACSNYPFCDNTVGCHPDSHRPLGTLASPLVRHYRTLCHRAFDPLWMEKKIFPSRRHAYYWLAEQMNLPLQWCHIACFDYQQCVKCIEICQQIDKITRSRCKK